PTAPASPFLLACVALAASNAIQVARAWRWRLRLLERGHWQVPTTQALRLARRMPQTQWLGRGVDWTPRHAQRMRLLLQYEPSSLAPPRWLQALARACGYARACESAPSLRLIEGVDANPKALFVSATALGSHTLVFGQTGAGKTRLAELIVTSFLARHADAAVIVLDPKGDRALRASLARACQSVGRADAFLSLHPAFPAQSIRFDPLRNFARTTSIATRIASLLPVGGGSEAFAQFAWRALHRVADAMVYAGARPTLSALRRYLEDDARPLLAQVLAVWEGRHPVSPVAHSCGVPGPCAPDASRVRSLVDSKHPTVRGAARATQRMPERGARSSIRDPRLTAAVARYRAYVEWVPTGRAPAVDGLLSLVEHDAVHFSKMIQNLLPLMTALTAGDLGPLLSPDAAHAGDTRPIFDARKVIEQRRCLYVGLDSLTDATVGAAIGAITLADLAQVAGELFNHGGERPVPVLVFIDEAAEVVTAPLIQLLNKSRGAGFTLYLAAQTVHDYEARLGSAAAAQMLLGNPGNVIALRTVDPQTQRFCTESVVQTEVDALAESRTVGLRATQTGAELSGAIGMRRDRREVELFAPAWLGLLPDLHYFARIAGGRTIKGELPRLTERTSDTR
ncbi:MAG: type IV secretion system DNA-binding domain-containing protein, partial [Proteobacteria bacterium]|nr:type IV secretion system DNA-binding domain-containing protein [Burkholderiales bacterium]